MDNNQTLYEVSKKRINSNSDYQLKIEQIQIEKLESELKISGLGNNNCLSFKSDADSKIKPDIYSAEHHIIGEIYTHLGKLKSAQMHKIAADILKMVVFCEDSGLDFEKYYIVCDEATRESLLSNAAIKNACRIYNIHLKCFALDETLREELQTTMKKQDISR